VASPKEEPAVDHAPVPKRGLPRETERALGGVTMRIKRVVRSPRLAENLVPKTFWCPSFSPRIGEED
jgi:hypothetical protein